MERNLAPFIGCAVVAYAVLDWNIAASWLAGVAFSTTSVAVVYAVMLEFGLNATGDRLRALRGDGRAQVTSLWPTQCRCARAAQNLPIGSGVVEAACKTLATQRMKRSGMRWRHAGGQAILRALHQSERFDRAWQLLSGTYQRIVEIPENVVLSPKRTVR